MRSHQSQGQMAEDRFLIVDDTDEDACELLTIICDGDPRFTRGFDIVPEARCQYDGRFQDGSYGGRA